MIAQSKDFSSESLRNAPNTHIWSPETYAVRGTFVLAPGRGDDSRSYARLGNRLVFDGYRTILLSRAAKSSGEVDNVLDRLAQQHELVSPVILVGVDSSAASVSRSASDNEERIAGLVLAGASASPSTAAPTTLDEEISLRTSCPVHTLLLTRILDKQAFSDESDDRTSEWRGLRRVEVPTLVIHSENDRLADAQAVIDVTAGWPQREVTLVADHSHDVLNGANHRSVAAALVSFAERLRADPAAAPILRSA